VATLRQEILSERYPAGTGFPTQDELVRRFGVARATIQQVIGRLVQHGLIKPKRGSGTRVAVNPPHLTEYAIVIPSAPWKLMPWSRLYATLLNQAETISEADKRRFVPFFGMEWQTRSRDYPELLERVETGRLAGIIFATNPWRLIDTPVLEKPGIPRVALMCSPGFPQVAKVCLGGSFWQKALDYLAARNRKRIALISVSVSDTLREIQPLLSERGMSTQGNWMMPVSPANPEGARTFIQLLLDSRGDRPDALVIADDNLVEEATAGLVATGVRVGEDLDVIAHSNFPWSGPTIVPLKRLGYDIRSVLLTCVDLLDRQRRGGPVPNETKIKAIFEEELVAVPHAVQMQPHIRGVQ